MKTVVSATECQEIIENLAKNHKELSECKKPEDLINVLACAKPPQCPHCKERENIGRHGKCSKGILRFYCISCTEKNNGKRRTFLATNGSIFHYLHKRKEFIEYINLMLENESFTIGVGASACKISKKISFEFRHKIGTALEKLLAKFLTKKIKKKGKISIEFMEKGGSVRKAPIEQLLESKNDIPSGNIQANEETTDINEHSQSSTYNKSAKKIHIKETLTLVHLKADSTGRIGAILGHHSSEKEVRIEPLNAKFMINLHMELKRFFAGTFKGVSTRYLGTYTSWHLLKMLKISLYDLLKELVSCRDNKSDYFSTYKNNIWDLKNVQHPSAA